MWLSTKLMKKESFLVSVVNKSQYRDTHSVTPSVTCKTLIIFPLFGAVNSKQHTINTVYASFFLMKPVFIPS